jgi:lipoprotein NlpD
VVVVVSRYAVLAALFAALVVSACAPWQPAPGKPGGGSRGEATADTRRVIQAPPAFYEVRRGDTLYSIAFRFGLDWRAVANWNDIQAPFTIRPGQELRLREPPRARPTTVDRPVAQPRPADEQVAEESSPRPVAESRAEPPPSSHQPESAPAVDPSAPARSVAGVSWQWPTQGRVTRPFDAAATRKGIGIAGQSGQTVTAASGGEVVYSGTALIGYGELIIIKHSDKLLSAYGHNRRRLVAEGDQVQRGQKIAEMGANEREETLLHFEIRRDGEPVNPLDYLPRR